MPDEKKRHFWQVRRFWGGLFGVTAAALLTIPGAPVVVTVGSIAITTQTISILVGGVGTYVFGYGQGKAVERGKEKE